MGSTGLQSRPREFDPKTGIDAGGVEAVAGVLSDALADSFSLYTKTLGVHWNVVGASFYGVHKLTEEQYQDLGEAIDAIAERIRALGHIAPAAFGDFAARSCVESKATITSAENMIEALVADNEAIARRLRQAVSVADEADDVFTADFLTARVGRHEKNVWMLKAITS